MSLIEKMGVKISFLFALVPFTNVRKMKTKPQNESFFKEFSKLIKLLLIFLSITLLRTESDSTFTLAFTIYKIL